MDTRWIVDAGIAVGTILTAVGGVLASRGRARADEVHGLRTRAEQLQAERDALLDYAYDCRRALHSHEIDPPPWPDAAGPPWIRGGEPRDG